MSALDGQIALVGGRHEAWGAGIAAEFAKGVRSWQSTKPRCGGARGPAI